ncbi:MAG: hypothetical protein Q9M40_07180 [Sulfurimonas sp.]|nr:hypothetical protein [Sulfurimonas sp.]
MMRLLDNLIVLKEIDSLDLGYSSADLRERYPHKIVVIRKISYIYKDVLCDEAKQKITSLDDYIQMGALAEVASMEKDLFNTRIMFKKNNPNAFAFDMFEYIKVCNIIYLKIDTDFKYLLKKLPTFLRKLKK